MAIRDKSKLYLGIPSLVPDKIIGEPITGTFTTDSALSPGFGATYEGMHTIANPAGVRAFPISRFTLDGTNYFGDFSQFAAVTVVTAVTATQIKYRWASNSFPHTVAFQTVLVSMG
jgi:hypothetical protein